MTTTFDYFVIALFIITTLIVVKKSGFFTWVRPSMEGKDQRASARAITNFWYVALNTALAGATVKLAFLISEQTAPTSQAIMALNTLKWLIVIYNVTILLIFGIVSAQNLTEGIRAFRGGDAPDPEPTVVESKTVTTIQPGTQSKTDVKTSTSGDVG